MRNVYNTLCTKHVQQDMSNITEIYTIDASSKYKHVVWDCFPIIEYWEVRGRGLGREVSDLYNLLSVNLTKYKRRNLLLRLHIVAREKKEQPFKKNTYTFEQPCSIYLA